MEFEQIGVSPEDLSYRVARNAHSGTSFSPEDRARQEQQAYYEDIQNVFKLFADRITPDQEGLFLEAMTRYRKGNLSRRLDYLYSRSRVISAMITAHRNSLPGVTRSIPVPLKIRCKPFWIGRRKRSTG